MRVMVFTEGTILYHNAALGQTRDSIVQQVKERHPSIFQFSTYIPICEAQRKLLKWRKQGHEILYLTSRTKPSEVQEIKDVLTKHHFPEGELLHRSTYEDYNQIVAKNIPDIILEDDCESIGGLPMTVYFKLDSELKIVITSITVKEFAGIDHLPDELTK